MEDGQKMATNLRYHEVKSLHAHRDGFLEGPSKAF